MLHTTPFLRRTLFVGLLGLGVALAAPAAHAKDVLVFAAASMKNALDEVVDAYKAKGGGKVAVSYASSSALAKQVENGAPADLFVSADQDWMDYLAQRGLIKPETRVNLLGNRLVLVASADSTLTVDIKPGVDLATALSGGRLAMGEPSSVPAGKYGKASLEALGAWDAVKGKVASAETVRNALTLVSRKEAPLGIVYETDARADPGVKIVGTFPAATHPAIIYPAAVLKDSAAEQAAAFFAFLTSDEAAPLFQKQGFTVKPASN